MMIQWFIIFTEEEKWSSLTWARISFVVANRIIPYFADGIAYTQM
ncbi:MULTISPECIES: hypothetical protein [unclassified Bartonella]